MAGGSIVRLKVKNFMTYDNLEITPCPGLNLITGPNGTGKSSLLCAMCLGLGGKPCSIGRSDKISDYVKNGCEKACIEIELLNPDGQNIVIERIINTSNSSHWSLNGKSASLKMVEKEIAKFNIQTSNLCQFLPQEKVADFTKMNQKELLESTEQAVGDQSMYDNHVKLKELRTQHYELLKTINGMRETLERDIEANKRLEGEVKQHKERQKHLKKIKSLEKRIEWMRYEEIRTQYVKKGKEKNKLVTKCKESLRQLEPLKRQIQQIDQELQQNMKNSEAVDREIQKTKLEVSDVKKKMDEVDSKISDMKYEVTEKIKEESERFQKIESAKAVLRRIEEELKEEHLEDANNKKELQNITNDTKNLHYLRMQADDKMNNCRNKQVHLMQCIREAERSKDKLAQYQYHRLNFLRQREPDTYQAIMWLRENHAMFKKKIYEPILTLIDVKDPQAVKYIENHVSYRDLVAFCAEDPDDMNEFLRIVSDDKGLHVNGIYSVPVPDERFHPKMSIDHLQRLGLTHNLGELFSAPAPVMSYLRRNYKLDHVPVGYEYTPEKIRRILGDRKFPFSKFFLGDFVYKIRTSKYGEHSKSSTSQKITESGLLQGSVDTSRLQAYENQLQQLTENLRNEKQEYEVHCQDERNYSSQIERLRAQKKILVDKGIHLKNLYAKSEALKQQIRSLMIPVCNIDEERHRLLNFLATAVQNKRNLSNQLCKLVALIYQLEKQKAMKCTSHFCMTVKKNDAVKSLESESEEYHTMEKLLEEIKNEIVKLKSEVNIALASAKKAIGLKSSDAVPADLGSKLEKEFEGLPNTVAELELEISREQAKLNCIYQTNPAVIDQYVEREKAINERKSTIAATEQELEALAQSINDIKDRWLPSIESLIAKISRNFSQYFYSLDCAGEVSLDKTDNPMDFEKYGISIKVKFRHDEPLTQLSHAHHSGGECSVSTILFILSLQELTDVPFRCVDEINQGMDSANERNVFNLIVKSSCSKKKSQYFLITPKLLHGLEYPKEMEIAIIHNGSSQKFNWNIDKFLKIKSSLQS